MKVCSLCKCGFFVKQKTAYEMRISDWSSDVCSSDLFVSSEATSAGPAFSDAIWAASVIPRVLRVRRGADLRPELLHLIEPGGRRRHPGLPQRVRLHRLQADRKSTRLNSSH